MLFKYIIPVSVHGIIVSGFPQRIEFLNESPVSRAIYCRNVYSWKNPPNGGGD